MHTGKHGALLPHHAAPHCAPSIEVPTNSNTISAVCHHGATAAPARLCGPAIFCPSIVSAGKSCILSSLSVIFLWILMAASSIESIRAKQWIRS
jgi:hypothetical protein